ncbi:MAG: FxsA family protein [Proteobacteria bacterium]|nr:FxsA family protein [Pseudomonadota bacterium]
MRYALIAFITVPLVEMIILIEIGGLIGAIPTVGLVILTATIGLWLLRLEGTATLARVQEKLAQGQLPETELLEGIMLLIGGALLLTPGFITDGLGFACLLPGLRRPIARRIIRQGILKAANLSGRSFQAGQASRPAGTTIDGDFIEQDR